MLTHARTLALAIATFTSLAGIASTANAQTYSGLMLGIECYETYRGLRVIRTLPGFPADGLLQRGDVVTGIADGRRVYSTQNIDEIEYAKDRIGPNREAAVRVMRPNVGTVYFFVEFTPIGVGANEVGQEAAEGTQFLAKFTEVEDVRKAERMFNGIRQGDGSNDQSGTRSGNGREVIPVPAPSPSRRNPADFFRREAE